MAKHPEPPLAPMPYAGAHEGPRRVLDLLTRRGVLAGPSVQVTVDGAVYPTAWGHSRFEIPGDRPVGVTVHQPMRGGVGVAGVVLPPGEEPSIELEYRGPAHPSRPGALGAPGTVKQQGVGTQVALLGCLGLLLLAVVAVLVAVLVAAG